MENETMLLLIKLAILWTGVGQFILIIALAGSSTSTSQFVKLLAICTGPIGLILLAVIWGLFSPFLLYKKLKVSFVTGYELGHNDTVESQYTDAGDRYEDAKDGII